MKYKLQNLFIILVLPLLFLLVFYSNTYASNDWQKSTVNPILSPTFSNTWDSQSILDAFLIKIKNQYNIYYAGNNGSGWEIGYASSNNGIDDWNRNISSTLTVGSTDSWETETSDPTVLQNNIGKFHMYYTSLNTSHWVSGLDRYRIRHAVSTDGINWTPDSGWVLEGTAGKWDEGGAGRGKSIVKVNGTYYMFYAGTNSQPLDSNPYWRIGLATSTDGINWTKQNNGNEVIDPTQPWELNNVSYPTVLYENGLFKMWYGAGTGDQPTQIVYAESSDGIHWNKPADQNPVLTPSSSGFDTQFMNPNVILHENNQYRLYYSGFNGSNWSIGLATLQDTVLGAKDLNVPLLKQTDPVWGGQSYDSANLWSPLHPAIGDWGCAMTSAAMVLQYYGITKLPNNKPLDPGTLNTWLKSQPDGYVGDGLLNWLAISRLTKLAKVNNPSFTYDALEYTRGSNGDTTQLTNDITNNQPDILEEPGHFIVGKGINGNTFDINDPYYNRNDINNTAYNNTFLSLGRYIPSHTNLSYLLLTTDPTVDIMLTNGNGAKAGSDGTQTYTDIPDATYFIQQGTTDPLTNSTSPSLKELMVPMPDDDNYTITVSSTMSGNQKFNLKLYAYTTDGTVDSTPITGTIKPNQPVSYTLNYQEAPGTGLLPQICNTNKLNDHDKDDQVRKFLCKIIQKFHKH